MIEPSVLQGRPGSRGVVTGTARVVSTVMAAYELTPGDIMVCPMTDPAWTPVFSRVGGVVAEQGGMLCHAAIVARERGIPAVVGLLDAMADITDGSIITVDGAAGTVTIVTRAAPKVKPAPAPKAKPPKPVAESAAPPNTTKFAGMDFASPANGEFLVPAMSGTMYLPVAIDGIDDACLTCGEAWGQHYNMSCTSLTKGHGIESIIPGSYFLPMKLRNWLLEHGKSLEAQPTPDDYVYKEPASTMAMCINCGKTWGKHFDQWCNSSSAADKYTSTSFVAIT